MRLATVAEMRAIEREANERGVRYGEMMEHAGRGVAEIINDAYSQIEVKNALGLVGSGNNGGDTLVALEALAKSGWSVCACLLRPRTEGDELVERVRQADGKVYQLREGDDFTQLDRCIKEASVLLDGVLGTGTQLPLRTDLEAVLQHVAKSPELPLVVAVDCPSGVDCASGEASPATIHADLTICMEAVKTGLLKFPANDYIGELIVVDLGLPKDLKSAENWKTWVLTDEDVRAILPKRGRNAHKGTFGTALIVAGSRNYTGAALLAGEAAYRIGAGLVQMAVPAEIHPMLAGSFLEATWLPLPDDSGAISAQAAKVLYENIERATAVLIGPGVGMAQATANFLREFFVNNKGGADLPPCILDADALKLMAAIPDWHKHLPAESVLTPHPGEMSVLTGLSVSEIQADRIAAAKKNANLWGHVVVLKGALSVVATPDGRVYVIPVATAALARAGTGDVLAGLIAGLRAQGVPAFESAAAGCWVHAQAGLYAEERMGQSASVLAGDVLAAVPDVLADIASD